MSITQKAVQNRKIRRVNLVFPPYVSPSCVPIGIASLKSYIEEKTRDVHVRNIDLNIEFINKLVDGKTEKICDICSMNEHLGQKPFKQQMSKQYAELLKSARNLTKDKTRFCDKDLFVRQLQPLQLFLLKYFSCFSNILRQYLEGRILNEASISDLFRDEQRRITEEHPDIIGFSALTYTQIGSSIALAKIVKEKTGITVVLGGPAFFNLDLKELMEAFDFLDFIVIKEGEEALLELIKALDGKIDFEQVPNLVWRKNGEIIFNSEKIIENLDELPTPDFSDLRLNSYYSPELILPISSARGCPWNLCKFCQLNIQYGGKHRQRSIEKVVNDIKILKQKHKASHFFFTDSEISAARLREIGQSLSKENMQIYFGCYARPTKDLNWEVLNAAYQGGCRFLQLGIESLSDDYLRLVQKGTTRESILDVLRNADKLGIGLLCYMLGGIPSQTSQELLSDAKEITALQKQYNIFSVMYCLYSLATFQQFYLERERYGIEIAGRRIAFSTKDLEIVHMNDTLQYNYKDRTAYGLLKDCDCIEVDSPLMAVMQMAKMNQLLGINGDNISFISIINDLLFETQLLYCIKD
jgi:biotin synthase-like enzyme